MTDRDPMAGEQAAAERAPEQQGDSSWPKPGEEGYVHPDGTPQAARQLAENRQAAQDRAAAGSLVSGEPRGGVSQAAARAENYSGPTEAERRESLTTSIEEGRDAVADEQAAAVARAEQETRTAAPKTGKSADGVKPAGQTTR